MKWGEFTSVIHLVFGISHRQPRRWPRLVMNVSVVCMSFNYLQIISSVIEWTSVPWHRLKCCHRWKIPVPLSTSINNCFLYWAPHIITINKISILLNKNEDARIVTLLAYKDLHRWHWRWAMLCLLAEGAWWIDSSSVSETALKAHVLYRAPGLSICSHTGWLNWPSLLLSQILTLRPHHLADQSQSWLLAGW